VETQVEVRAFAGLKQIFEERGWPFPYYVPLEKECSALELARMLDLPVEKIEAVFINRLSDSLDTAKVKPGDRVAFVPHGTPGVARLLLGIKREPDKGS
jgi:hypothetical protein